ncbi:MAG: uracil phosphoribosyltransferase [Halobacteriovoraceae bacterium]|jgi:uracil phosphoribosyltransferase|nr:uracil phosphoribosyltransferase [Halobacteriovoraceae bacterium]
MSKKLIEISHPLVAHKLGFLRDKNTNSDEFRRIVTELTMFLGVEATKDLVLISKNIETPMTKTKVDQIKSPPVIVSILRAGNGMLDSMLTLLPFCPVGHIGIYRDKFIDNTVEYYFKLPENVEGRDILLIDPMLATGDTALASIDRLKQYKVGKIKFLTILSNQHGIARLHEFHPDVDIYTLSSSEQLDKKGYLMPGLGDAGDRLFGTK